jgi:hypothetical protein
MPVIKHNPGGVFPPYRCYSHMEAGDRGDGGKVADERGLGGTNRRCAFS